MSEPETTNVDIRHATSADASALASFITPFVADGKLLPRTVDELMGLLPNCFVAETPDGIVGCAALEIYSAKLAEVRSLAVASQYQRSGLGKRLVERCIEVAHELQVFEVMAITSSERFFKSCGFDFTLPGEKKALFIRTRDEH